MTYDYQKTAFSQALLAGLFAGIMATLANLTFNFIYREITDFQPSEIVNVSTVIFASVLVPVVGGVVLFFLEKATKNGSAIYMVLFVVLSALCIYSAFGIQRSSIPKETHDFRGLFIGIVIITGGLISFYIPYLNRHGDFI